MAWNVIRTATKEDLERLQKAAAAFAVRHKIEVWDGMDPVRCVEDECEYKANKAETKLRRLWIACVWRAVRDRRAEGVAWGKIGYSVEF